MEASKKHLQNRVLERLSYSYQSSGECGHVWSGTFEGLDSSDGGFFILLDRPDLELVDLCFVGTIVEEWQVHVLAALEYLRLEVKSRPGYFGLTHEAADLYASTDLPDNVISYLNSRDSPVRNPLFVFDESRDWSIQLLECDFPASDCYGVLVSFHDEKPLSVSYCSDEYWAAVHEPEAE